MPISEILLLNRHDVTNLLTINQCIPAVEQAFKMFSTGSAPSPGVLGIQAGNGGFHIKAGIMNLGSNYFVAKINANFPGNNKKYGLPTIQGVIIVCDADNGNILALMDSIEITILRTGAATAVAAKWLAKENARTITICGAGNQGKISLRAVMKIRPIEKAFIFDIDEMKAGLFAEELLKELDINIRPVNNLKEALRQSDICVTCTPSKKYFLPAKYVSPGTFIAAVGADNEDKQELEPALLVGNKLVTDITTQCAGFGELHHAIDEGIMNRSDVYAELGEIIAGKKPGRTTDEEIIIFDSTGTALQDIVSAALVYEKALERNTGRKMVFSD